MEETVSREQGFEDFTIVRIFRPRALWCGRRGATASTWRNGFGGTFDQLEAYLRVR